MPGSEAKSLSGVQGQSPISANLRKAGEKLPLASFFWTAASEWPTILPEH
jgi:hypothetical protein